MKELDFMSIVFLLFYILTNLFVVLAVAWAELTPSTMMARFAVISFVNFIVAFSICLIIVDIDKDKKKKGAKK